MGAEAVKARGRLQLERFVRAARLFGHRLPDLESLPLLPPSWEGSAAAREGRRERPRLGGGGRRQAAREPKEAAGGAAGGPGAVARQCSPAFLPSNLVLSSRRLRSGALPPAPEPGVEGGAACPRARLEDTAAPSPAMVVSACVLAFCFAVVAGATSEPPGPEQRVVRRIAGKHFPKVSSGGGGETLVHRGFGNCERPLGLRRGRQVQ